MVPVGLRIKFNQAAVVLRVVTPLLLGPATAWRSHERRIRVRLVARQREARLTVDAARIDSARRGFENLITRWVSVLRRETAPGFGGGQVRCSKFGVPVGQSHELMHASKTPYGAAPAKSLSALTRQSN